MTAAYDGHREKCVEAVELREKHGNLTAASRASGIPRQTLLSRIETAELKGWIKYKTELREVSVPIPQEPPPPIPPEEILLAKHPQAAYAKGSAFQLVSRPDNTFLFGACGDQHVGSKHYREDVANDLYARYQRAGVQVVFNTGNWIDGEAHFNRHDLVVHGIDEQARLLAEVYPRVPGIETYAVWGADHEGWYSREGIDVGSYVEGVMRNQGRTDWHDLGFMEAHVDLVNYNSLYSKQRLDENARRREAGEPEIPPVSAKLAVVHPGGGSAYAISYRPQKILESYESGEKPAILLLGHYHKLDAGLVRNVWYGQTGTAQDQSVFMRQKSIEAHVGGLMIHAEQDPETGAITGFTPSIWRYFNKGYYNNRWSRHGYVTQPPRTIGGL